MTSGKAQVAPVATDAHFQAAVAWASLPWWCRLVDRGYQHPAHLLRLCKTLERVERGECRRLLVAEPPRHGKSLTTTRRFPAWFLGRHPDLRVIIAAHTARLAQGFSRDARNSMLAHARRVFGVQLAGDSSSVEEWSIAGHKGGLVAAGVDGPLTGQGADLLVIDDPVKDHTAAFSATQRDAVWEWYRTVARTRLHPGGRIVLVQTRWHQDDLAGRLLREAEDGGEQWEQLVMPMVDDAGAILWPEKFSREEVDAIRRAVGSYAWEALYQQRPAAPSGNIFKRTWWRRWSERDDIAGVRVLDLSSLQWVAQSWDCTFKATDGTDYVVGQLWGGIGADRFLLDQVRDRMDFVRTLREIKALTAKWAPRLERHAAYAKLVEDKANGPAVINTLQSEVAGLIAVNPEGGKEARARAVSPQVEAGNVFLPADAQWVEAFIGEAADFPAGAHDDQVDALSQLLLRQAGPQNDLNRLAAMASL